MSPLPADFIEMVTSHVLSGCDSDAAILITKSLVVELSISMSFNASKPSTDRLGQDFIDASGILMTSFVLPLLVTESWYSTEEPAYNVSPFDMESNSVQIEHRWN